MARLVSLAVLTTLIVFLGITFFQVIAPFLLPLFLAGVLAILCQPVFHWFYNRTGKRTHLAAGITTILILSMILVPLTAGTFIATRQLYRFAQDTSRNPQLQKLMESVGRELKHEQVLHRIEEWTGEELDASEMQRINDLLKDGQKHLRESLMTLVQRTLGVAGAALNILGDAFGLFISMVIFLIAFFYFLADGPELLASTQQMIPVQQDYQRQLVVQFNQVVRAVVLATFLAAIAQGLATGIGMSICGFGNFVLITALSTLMSLVPFVGTWLIWGPAAAWLAWTGHVGSAIFLVVYGLVFVGMIDNVIRTYILNSNVKLHPLLAFVSVLGGLQVMGLWGVFIGPIVASCLYALVKIFNAELQAYSLERISLATSDITVAPIAAGPLTGVSAAIVTPDSPGVAPPPVATVVQETPPRQPAPQKTQPRRKGKPPRSGR